MRVILMAVLVFLKMATLDCTSTMLSLQGESRTPTQNVGIVKINRILHRLKMASYGTSMRKGYRAHGADINPTISFEFQGLISCVLDLQNSKLRDLAAERRQLSRALTEKVKELSDRSVDSFDSARELKSMLSLDCQFLWGLLADQQGVRLQIIQCKSTIEELQDVLVEAEWTASYLNLDDSLRVIKSAYKENQDAIKSLELTLQEERFLSKSQAIIVAAHQKFVNIVGATLHRFLQMNPLATYAESLGKNMIYHCQPGLRVQKLKEPMKKVLHFKEYNTKLLADVEKVVREYVFEVFNPIANFISSRKSDAGLYLYFEELLKTHEEHEDDTFNLKCKDVSQLIISLAEIEHVLIPEHNWYHG